jgi:hypothetical protein
VPAAPAAAAGPAAGVQREGAPAVDEEEPLQALHIQREDEDKLEDEPPA